MNYEVDFHEEMLAMYERNAESCAPKRYERVLAWFYRVMTGWFFLSTVLYVIWGRAWYWSLLQFALAWVWVFNTRTMQNTARKQAERRERWLEQAEDEREIIRMLDPTHPLVIPIIEEEP